MHNKREVQNKRILEKIGELGERFECCKLRHIQGHAYHYSNVVANRLAKKAIYGYERTKMMTEIQEAEKAENEDLMIHEKMTITAMQRTEYMRNQDRQNKSNRPNKRNSDWRMVLYCDIPTKHSR